MKEEEQEEEKKQIKAVFPHLSEERERLLKLFIVTAPAIESGPDDNCTLRSPPDGEGRGGALMRVRDDRKTIKAITGARWAPKSLCEAERAGRARTCL